MSKLDRLLLEFTKAFALWRQDWTEEPWMKKLRVECQTIAKRKNTENKINSRWERTYLKEQLAELLISLDTHFEEYFFQKPQNIEANTRLRKLKLVNSNITWLCCDIVWILEEISPDEAVNLEIPQELLRKLKIWCRKAWPEEPFGIITF
ncbi:hypothetical protein N7478_002181 [Penicillium angulare]|uniref:uncharacterized protein n=1 Tax=Penicillium angulare TaxID=116970 RepID=UPI00253FD021|nr:uncharacterized protein N7478_002181 [Penicillium angulare]KAJ5289151.1 hypothetical protein N7478_002181 [Penicillium angulare]